MFSDDTFAALHPTNAVIESCTNSQQCDHTMRPARFVGASPPPSPPHVCVSSTLQCADIQPVSFISTRSMSLLSPLNSISSAISHSPTSSNDSAKARRKGRYADATLANLVPLGLNTAEWNAETTFLTTVPMLSTSDSQIDSSVLSVGSSGSGGSGGSGGKAPRKPGRYAAATEATLVPLGLSVANSVVDTAWLSAESASPQTLLHRLSLIRLNASNAICRAVSPHTTILNTVKPSVPVDSLDVALKSPYFSPRLKNRTSLPHSPVAIGKRRGDIDMTTYGVATTLIGLANCVGVPVGSAASLAARYAVTDSCTNTQHGDHIMRPARFVGVSPPPSPPHVCVQSTLQCADTQPASFIAMRSMSLLSPLNSISSAISHSPTSSSGSAKARRKGRYADATLANLVPLGLNTAEWNTETAALSTVPVSSTPDSQIDSSVLSAGSNGSGGSGGRASRKPGRYAAATEATLVPLGLSVANSVDRPHSPIAIGNSRSDICFKSSISLQNTYPLTAV